MVQKLDDAERAALFARFPDWTHEPVRDGIVRLTGSDEPTRTQWKSILRPNTRQVLAWLLTEQTIDRARATTNTKANP